DTLRRVDDIIGVSRYVADYVRRWSGIEAVHVPISLLDPGPWPWLGNFDNEFVTLVNPCAVKGIAIFLALASAMPCTRFAAVPTWGTSQADLEALRRLPNITILNSVDDIDEILGRTRVLLVPSLWAEARSRIVVEAMLRAVPVVASNTGGIPEAKMGVPYLLPVRPIERYQSRVDENMVPIAEVPPQDTAPWLDALQRLNASRAHYDEIARGSREAAMHYATHLTVRPFEELLERAVAAPRRRTPPAPAHGVEMLSPEKRRLLDLRLRKRAESKWFVTAGAGATRLFCFPYAGAGTLAYRSWAGALHDAALWAVRLPGRESRVSEPLFTRMEPLIEALGAELQKHVDAPFSFFGHSMGAGIAFELVRWLRRHHLPLPRRLIVSGARAPQLRRTPVPPLPENELLEQLRRLQGMPQGALENPDVVRLILPVLRADTELYRNYVYADEPPLDIQLHVFGGEDDPNVRPEHLEAWRDQSPARCTIRILRGGHFYFQRDPDAFFAALNTVLR
ncbi:MAG: alpha/beta fold hydrolase, partial [Acidobacteria bacterium]|nr:alpha/beta fold hydrolase [Acidobacteriota bacterium]